MRHRSRFGPSLLLVGSLALFLVLGGTAFALGKGSAAAKPVYQQRCQTGAVKAIVIVTGSASAGVGNIPDTFTTDPSVFRVRWSCVAKTTFQVRRVDRGIYDVRLVGNTAGTAIVTSFGDARGVGAIRQADGSFRVTLTGVRPGGDYGGLDNAFTLIAF
jgi:hypothetical protein